MIEFEKCGFYNEVEFNSAIKKNKMVLFVVE